ncbi:histidine phosphatase family protein [Pseudoramibacter faecis]|uniref:histidine phosphatase family protein n=1 Tax=Pseudoramibacter faecis TaxID=3108534 RepID=UPI003CC9C413
MTTLYLVRHGETYENKNHNFQGIMDSRLIPLELKQADALGKFFADIHLDAAFTSPLSRARRTMTGVLTHHPEVTPVVREKLHEIKGGKMTGLSFDECNKRFDNILMTFQSRPSAFAAPAGESIPEVYHRFTARSLRKISVKISSSSPTAPQFRLRYPTPKALMNITSDLIFCRTAQSASLLSRLIIPNISRKSSQITLGSWQNSTTTYKSGVRKFPHCFFNISITTRRANSLVSRASK